MGNKSKNTKIILFAVLTLILISVIGIVIFSMNKNKNEVSNSKNENEVVQNQIQNNTQNQVQNNTQNQVQNQTQNPVKNVVIPTESEQDELPKAISTPSNDKDEVTGSKPTE